MASFVDTAGLSTRAAANSPTNLDQSTLLGGIGEVAEILAAALVRVLASKSSRKSSSAGECSLDFSAGKSGDPTPHEGKRFG
jgi:hypothetical protein